MEKTANSDTHFLSNASNRYVVYKGNSMHPLLHDSELLVLEPYGEKLPNRGDVIVFDCPSLGYKVIHRVLSFNRNVVRTQGDSNTEPDSYNPSLSDIQGRVVGVCREGGTVRVSGGSFGVILGCCMRYRNNLARWRNKFKGI